MKVTSRKSIRTDTILEVTREDIINALNASGSYNIPYNARVWVNCERRDEYDISEKGLVNIRFNMTEDVPEEKNEAIPF